MGNDLGKIGFVQSWLLSWTCHRIVTLTRKKEERIRNRKVTESWIWWSESSKCGHGRLEQLAETFSTAIGNKQKY